MRKTGSLDSILVLAFSAVRLTEHFFPHPAFRYIVAALLVAIVVLTAPTLKKPTRNLLFLLLAVGAALLIASGADFSAWIDAITKNGSLIMLLMLVPLISLPLFYEDYQGELKKLAQLRVRGIVGFLALVLALEHTLSVIIATGAMVIGLELLYPFAALYNGERPFLKSMVRAYCSSGFWSPAWASVVVYTAYPNVKWLRIIPVGIAFALLFLGLSLLGTWLETRRHPGRYTVAALPEEGARSLDRRKLFTMLGLVLAMILSIVALAAVTKWDLMLVVAVVSLVFPAAVALVQKKLPAYRGELKRYYRERLPRSTNQVALFMLAGFLGKALDVSGAGRLMVRLLPDVMLQYPVLLIAALMLLMILPGLLGVHPAATGTALLAALTPAMLGLGEYTYALAILTGWLLTIMLDPFSAIGLMVAGYSGRSSFQVTVGNNWRFGLVCLAVFSPLIAAVGPLMG